MLQLEPYHEHCVRSQRLDVVSIPIEHIRRVNTPRDAQTQCRDSESAQQSGHIYQARLGNLVPRGGQPLR